MVEPVGDPGREAVGPADGGRNVSGFGEVEPRDVYLVKSVFRD